MAEEQQPRVLSTSSSVGDYSEDESQDAPVAPRSWKKRKWLPTRESASEKCRDIAWEGKRRKMLQQERRRNGIQDYCDDLTDEDLNELRGSIELGFGFNEEDGQTLCDTLPALDLYFAVNRQLSTSPVSTPRSRRASSSSASSPRNDLESWRICIPGFLFFIIFFICSASTWIWYVNSQSQPYTLWVKMANL